MKAIMMSIRPEWTSKILNKEKTIEIRKRFPSDYVGWVYIYCTKKEPYARRYVHNDKWGTLEYIKSDGKVVARFWCDKVEEIKGMFDELNREYSFENEKDLLNKSCLESDKLGDYLKIYNNNDYEKVGYAIHITKLEIFDKPREIKEFSKKEFDSFITGQIEHYKYPLTRAPQSWCYVEI